MKLPINKNELEIIIEAVKNISPKLYNKLWSYKINYTINVKKDGLP